MKTCKRLDKDDYFSILIRISQRTAKNKGGKLKFSFEGYCKSLLAEVNKKCISFIADVSSNWFS